ncbi:MAG TPA: carboxypeptidase-like regulatory domain-containing protein [Pyrinomonadaceae bacterium]|jgi:type 1 fimbria pilin
MNKKWIILLFSISIFVFSSASVFSQTTFTEISGTIKLRGSVIPNATVTVTNIRGNFSRSATTNEDGFYRFSNLPIDRYTIRVSMTGFREKRIEANVGIGQTNVFDIELDDNTSSLVSVSGSITGKVTDRGNNVIKDVKLSYAKKDTPQNKTEVEIGENGEFYIPELALGKYYLFFEAEGFEPKRKEVRVSDKEKKIDVKLRRK